MNNEKILYYLGILENGALNYYQTVETIRIASQSIQDYIEQLEEQVKKQKEVIDKAIETLEKGITFCENDSQGIYDKCNIAINREKKVLDILKEVSE
jgi:hypothetical protein|nr:MAG TPA: hypothetical protein [Bacteriophage sp.]